MLTPLIVLANSWKHHDYCIAGINPATGRSLRAVSDLNDGRIAKDAMQLDGYFPQLMDVIEIPLADDGPDFGFERENLSVELYAKNLFDDDSWDYGFRSVSFREPGGQQFVTIPAAALPPGSAPTVGFQQGMIVQPPDKRAIGLRIKYEF